MSNLTKLEFNALHVTGKNYLTWILDAEIHLSAMGLGDTIKEENKASEQDQEKAMIFHLHHLDEGLKSEYLTIKDPSTLWKDLKERYDHQKMVILPKARYDWIHLRLQDYKTRPTGSTPFPKVNVVTNNEYRDNKLFGRGHRYGHGRGRGSARGHGFVHGRGRNQQNPPNFKSKPYYQKRTINEEKSEGSTMAKRGESTCNRCGMKGHWRSTCRTSKHFVDLYQASLKNVETNFTEQNDPLGIVHLEAHLGSNDQVDPSAFTHMEVGEDVDVNMPKFGGGEPKNN
ncbi:uncharacterized protein LOC141696502 [Apium graveolens]|uniref:uncharacterized protein LOC141696502 n=1 Tax=Apium graveolens TaxID=4045 RepID=UPI003D7B0243